MKAELLFDRRRIFDDGSIMAMKIWRVPEPVSPSKHSLKYSLFYGRPGVRIIGYDNERSKGGHKHVHGREETYRFESVEQLIADFLADVKAARGGK